jgi:hypothetical protein
LGKARGFWEGGKHDLNSTGGVQVFQKDPASHRLAAKNPALLEGVL